MAIPIPTYTELERELMQVNTYLNNRIDALEKAIDGLIAYQYSGSQEAMNALQNLANLARGKA